jgi:hypothetical protein
MRNLQRLPSEVGLALSWYATADPHKSAMIAM